MKNNRSMLGVTAAVLLALVGGLLLWQSSGNDDSEAAEEAPAELVQVLVAARDIEAGESASTMSENAFAFVRLESIPADQALPDVLTTVEDLGDLALGRNVVSRPVTNGVQLRASDFVVPGQQQTSALPDVDENLFEVTIALEPQRALGGSVAVGQNVAVVASFDSGTEEESETVVILESVIVTNKQSEQTFTEQQLATDPFAPTLVTNSRVFITLGVEVADLEKLTFASEFGQIWLARQGEAATVDDSSVHRIEDVSVSLGDGADESNTGNESEAGEG